MSEVEDFNVSSLFPRRNGVNYAKISEIIDPIYQPREGNIDNQNYSYVEHYEDFTPQFEGVDGGKCQLDACTLGACYANLSPNHEKKKPKCQDRTWIDYKDGRYVFGVFDGHGSCGLQVSKTCITLLSEILHDRHSALNKKGEALAKSDLRPSANSFVCNEVQYLNQCLSYLQEVLKISNDFDCLKSGTTATIASVSDQKLSLVWVGDSKAVLFVSTKDDFSEMRAFNVTSMHNLSTKEEIKEIESAGGIVSGAGNVFGKGKIGPLRVFNKTGRHEPALNLSRSLGDELAHEVGVSHVGECFEIEFSTLKSTMKQIKEAIPKSFNRPGVDNDTPAFKKKNGFLKDKSLMQAKMNKPRGTGNRLMKTLERIRKTASLARTKSKKKNKSSTVHQTIKDSTQLTKTFSEFSLDGEPKDEKNASNDTLTNLEFELPIQHAILVVGSDGLWNSFDKEDMAKFLSKTMRTPEFTNLSKELCMLAQDKWKEILDADSPVKIDDISAVTAVLF